MNEVDIFKRSIKDFFSSQMLKLALIPLLLTMIILYIMFFGVASHGIDALKILAETSQNGEVVAVDEEAPFYFIWFSYLIVFLFKHSITAWLAGFLLYTIGAILVFHISVILTLIIIGFLTPFIVKYLQKQHYSSLILKPYGSLLGALWVFFKAFIIMILLYILLVPLYFIPLINLVAFYLPLYYFFHKLLNYDVSSTILSYKEYLEIYFKKANIFRIRTLFLYFISTIPFITLFVAVFYVIYLSHAYFIELEKISSNETKESV